MTKKTTREFEASFRRDPSDPAAFAALRRRYQAESRHFELAMLYERRAEQLDDVQAAADLLADAAALHAGSEDRVAEARVLRKALRFDPGHQRSLRRLKELADQDQRWVDLLYLLQHELDALEQAGADARRIARIDQQLGRLWEDKLFRLDRAIHHYRRAFKGDPGNSEAIDAGRRIYATVGRWPVVAQLYQVELANCSDNERRLALLLALGELRRDKLGDMEAAASCFSEACQLQPNDEQLLEALGEIYASPAWPTAGGLDKAAATFIQIAQRCHTRGDREQAIAYLRRALGADPENEAASTQLEAAYEETGRWEDLDRLYRQRLSVATDLEAVELSMRRGELLERKLGDRQGARQCYEAVLAHEPLGGPASSRLKELCRADGDFKRLLELLRGELELTTDRTTRTRLMMEIALLQRDKLGDPEAAALVLHDLLQAEPQHRKALEAYEDYFRAKGDFRNLTELLRYAAQSGREAGAAPMEVCALLEELAEVCEQRLGDLDGAIEAWQQIAELHPDRQRAEDALRRLHAKRRMWHKTVSTLHRELEQAPSLQQRVEVLRRMAQVYYDKQIDPSKLSDLLLEILQHDSRDERALRMLVDVCEREADHEGLASTLRLQLDGIVTKIEKVRLLRRLATLYADQLDRPSEAIAVYRELLALAPGDSDALCKLHQLLDDNDELDQLTALLQERLEAAESADQRRTALLDLAHLMDDRLEAPSRALDYWEQLHALVPDDAEAIAALCRLYQRGNQAEKLLELLLVQLRHRKPSSPAHRVELLQQIAEAADQLDRTEVALSAYEELAELLPASRQTLDALARIYASLSREEDLVRILGREIDLSEDPEERVALAFKQVDIMEDRLGDLDAAVTIYQRIIDEIAPGDLDAHRRLKLLHVRRNDYSRAAEIAEREFFLMPDDESGYADRRQLALEIAGYWWEQVQDPQRAQLAFERALELAPDNLSALLQLRRIYHRTESYERLIDLAPTLYDALEDDRERLVLLLEMAQVCEEKLFDPLRAFEWYRQAHDHAPESPEAFSALKQTAQRYELWEELFSVYQDRRREVVSSARHLELTEEMARICADRLDDPAKAFEVTREALAVDPSGEQIIGQLEQLADAAGLHDEMFDVYQQLIDAADTVPRKSQLLERRAQMAERQMNAPGRALADQVRRFTLGPADPPGLVEEIERLARAADRWDTAIKIHQLRLQQADSAEKRLEILQRIAELRERSLGDLYGALQTTLAAFAIDQRAEIINNAWRLARLVEKDAATRPPRDDTTLEIREEDLLQADQRPATGSGRKRPDETIELSLSDVGELLVVEPQAAARTDQTIELTLSDLGELIVKPGRPAKGRDEDQTMELSLSDLGELIVAPSRPPREDSTMEITGSQIIEVGRRAPPAATKPAAARSAAAKPPPPPTARSPWQLLVQAYLDLDPPDRAARINNLLAVAEVWHQGAGDLDRTFETLADAALLDPDDEGVEQRLLDLARAHDCFERVVGVYRQVIEHAADSASLLRLHLKVGRLIVAHGPAELAEAHFSAVLALQPDNDEATAKLSEYYEQQGKWQELAQLISRQLEMLWDRLGLEQRTERLHHLADLYLNRLDRPYEAADTLSRLVGENPTDSETLARLADLYERLALWPKYIDTLYALVRLTLDKGEAARHSLRIARTFRDELELADRAIQAYEKVLDFEPDNREALSALQQLYQAHDQVDRLIEVLERQAGRAHGGPEQRPLLLELARAYLACGNPHAAAEALERARALGEPAAEIEEQLAQVLVQTGQSEEAVQLLRDQLDRARQSSAPPEEVATMLVRLARLQRDGLEDDSGSRQSLQQALDLAADHREALFELAQLNARQRRWDDCAELHIRLTDLSEDDDEASTALQAVAAHLVQAGADRAALRVYERALQRRPEDPELIDALLALTRDDPGRQQHLLGRKLRLTSEPVQRADLLTQLARLRQQTGASIDQVRAGYRQALEADPLAIGALDGLSALQVREGLLEEARELIEGALQQLQGTPAAHDAGPLYRRLGEVFERLDRAEDGYRYLMQALRLQPKNLALRLALGRNRYNAHRWREALRHLREGLDHPDRDRHAVAVADALYLAGQCERRLRRPERAPPYFQAAIELDPNNTAVLREIADEAISRGDLDGASTLLRRLADATSDRGEQIALLATLAELYQTRLDNEEAAAACYAQLVDVLAHDDVDEGSEGELPHGPKRAALLQPALPILRHAALHPQAARAAELWAEALDDGAEQCELLLVAAAEHQAAGDVERADLLRFKILDIDPSCTEAVEGLSQNLEQEEQFDQAVELIEQHLRRVGPPKDDEMAVRRAALYDRLARIQKQRGFGGKAIEALERRLKLCESIEARLMLASLYQEHPERAEAALANHRVLARDVRHLESLRALTRAAASAGATYRAHCLLEVLRALGQAQHEEQLLHDYIPEDLAVHSPFAGEITEDDRESHLCLPAVKTLREVFSTLREGTPALFAREITQFGVTADDRVSPVAKTDLAFVFSSIARALGIKRTTLYLDAKEGDRLTVVGIAPPAVIVPRSLAESRSVAELRFLLGRALELTQPAYVLATLPREEVNALLTDVLHAFHPRFQRPGVLRLEAKEAAESLRRQLPYKVSRQLAELFRQQPLAQFDSAAWRQAVFLSANRVGLLMCGDLQVALRQLRADEPELGARPAGEILDSSVALEDLLSFAASDGYYICRVKLGLGGQG